MSDPETPRPRPGPGARPRSGRRRMWLSLAAALVPAIPIAAAVVITSGQPGPNAVATVHFQPVVRTPVAAPRPAPAPGTQVALVVHPTAIHSTPGGRVIAHITTRTEFGSPQAMWVQRRSGGWLGVVSPLAGNNKLGWIPLQAASLTNVTWELRVSLKARKLTVLELGRVRARYTVGIGAPAAPTPPGRFAVTDRLTTGNLAGPYGCCIIALSAHSPHAIAGWTGGDRIAIHSTPDTASIGRPDSHGCVRVTMSQGRWLLGHIPLGTPALISG